MNLIMNGTENEMSPLISPSSGGRGRVATSANFWVSLLSFNRRYVVIGGPSDSYQYYLDGIANTSHT